ncbi:hypothetical protein GCM10027280_17570 [Micromonospora polyrhachis]|uniref:Uncharacterized protein n=1 Tax=Micromonospora polyrhachis TaxID=1282883 RepID=A0A7W7WMI4_9ACTN|nr:hypothetical protein [Micromonospora polyrhachis]MBB4956855.1 hypothetical protein [Micromonospora polyrhachis]
MPVEAINTVPRDLLVRHLEHWTPTALRRSRRATFAQAYGGSDRGTAEATIRVFARFAGALRGRQLTVVALAAPDEDLTVRVGAAQAELPAEVGVHLVAGDLERMPVTLRAAGAAGAPVLAYLDATVGAAPSADTLAAVAAAGRPGEVLLVLGAQARAELDYRRILADAGFPLVTAVELVDVGATRLLVFATSLGRSLDAFKEAMWAMDGTTGVRYRDPRDPAGEPAAISPEPPLEPLRRTLLDRLTEVGAGSVTELRQFTAAETIYRATDALTALTGLLDAGLITREPQSGRLAGDVIIASRSPEQPARS